MQNFSTDILLMAVPELKEVAPKHYATLVQQAEQATFKTSKPYWREVLIVLTAFMSIYIFGKIVAPDSLWISGVFTVISLFASALLVDLLYFRRLKKAIIARLALVQA
ncbi:hypothetical protein [Undibacterium sp. TS12]|uniref:hypothetical protein n=1 Tax=Undibacterium sp. TS12 TaxID=2908202 RepID=UPI001F4D1BBA|nr:hypothetical protein [Undibacterium sp. TS12]MCH8618108.1 hypothetical protein [Undibacterium sp. TS12]